MESKKDGTNDPICRIARDADMKRRETFGYSGEGEGREDGAVVMKHIHSHIIK